MGVGVLGCHCSTRQLILLLVSAASEMLRQMAHRHVVACFEPQVAMRLERSPPRLGITPQSSAPHPLAQARPRARKPMARR